MSLRSGASNRIRCRTGDAVRPRVRASGSPASSTSTASLWEYEPVEFALEWDADGRPTAGFRPDFWLPEPGLFVELTTLNQRLVTKKNGKVRRLGQLYPDVRVTLLYQRDTLALLAKYGLAGDGLAPPASPAPPDDAAPVSSSTWATPRRRSAMSRPRTSRAGRSGTPP